MRKHYALLDKNGAVTYKFDGTEIKATGDGQVLLIDLNSNVTVMASEYFYVKAIFNLSPGDSIMEVTDGIPSEAAG